ncbi:MAG: ABC transporter permease [Zhaonellaceae bacterium]|jgi:ABC-type uncharacterized transport system permease subunit|nr:ABC transporter permease [Clostridia bacterium]
MKICESAKKIISPVVGVFTGIFVGALIMLIRGFDPLVAYKALFMGAFGSVDNFITTLIKTTPLGLTGLAVLIAYRAGIFNIGCEGQLQLGAIMATVIGVTNYGLSDEMHIIVCIMAAMLAGIMFAMIPAIAKIWRGYNEIVVTMLLNYVAVYFTQFLLQGALREPGQMFPQSARLLVRLPVIFSVKRLHIGIVFFLLASVFLYLLLNQLSFGFRVRAVGLNPNACDYAGISSKRTMLSAMIISGALAGLAGACEVMGVHGRLVENFSPGYGYDAIAVALLANLHPLGVLASALFFGVLRSGAANMQIATNLPVAFVQIVQGVAVICVIILDKLPDYLRSMGRTTNAI